MFGQGCSGIQGPSKAQLAQRIPGANKIPQDPPENPNQSPFVTLIGGK